VHLGDGLGLDVRDSLDEVVKLVDLRVKLVVTEVQKSILDSNNFVSAEATGIVDIVAIFENQQFSLALSSDKVLLNRSALHVDLHVSHDDLISSVSSRGHKFLQLRSSLLQSESVGLVGYFLREFNVSKEARNLSRQIPGSQHSINTFKSSLLNVLLDIGHNVSAESSKRRRVRSREGVDSGLHSVDKVCLLVSGSSESTLLVNDNLAWDNLDFISASLFNLIRAF
jgi:hypothetical protein